jgi:protein-disulfide isomerase
MASKQPRRKRPVQAPKVRGPEGRRRQASPRILLVASVLALLLAVGIGVGIAVAGNGSSSPSSSSLKDVSTVRTLLRGIPQHGNVLGSPSAPVTLVEYVDMQCPYCDAFAKQVLPTVVPTYVRTGIVKMIVRPLAFIGPDSLRGRNAVIAAGKQGKFFNLMELLYFNQSTENTGWLSEAMVKRAATAVGLDPTQFDKTRNDPSVAAAATAFDVVARADKVHSTPTVLVGKTGGTLSEVQLSSPTDLASVANAIQLIAG